MKRISDIDPLVLANFRRGCVIPAQPLALDSNRKFAPRSTLSSGRNRDNC